MMEHWRLQFIWFINFLTNATTIFYVPFVSSSIDVLCPFFQNPSNAILPPNQLKPIHQVCWCGQRIPVMRERRYNKKKCVVFSASELITLDRRASQFDANLMPIEPSMSTANKILFIASGVLKRLIVAEWHFASIATHKLYAKFEQTRFIFEWHFFSPLYFGRVDASRVLRHNFAS